MGKVALVFTNLRRTPSLQHGADSEGLEALLPPRRWATIPRSSAGMSATCVFRSTTSRRTRSRRRWSRLRRLLLGLYQGVSMMERGVGRVANDIDRIFLYRRPILDYWVRVGEDLPHIVRQCADPRDRSYHFGLSDDDMEGSARPRKESRRAQPNA